MVCSPPSSRLTALQRDLIAGFFTREHQFFLTGGGALAGFYFGHRETEDLDFFSQPGSDLEDAARTLAEAAAQCGAALRFEGRVYPDFRRYVATRNEERCVVDLVIDRAPAVEPEKARFGPARIDTLREIAANKICALLSRSEIKDLVDLRAMLEGGVDLERAFDDADVKEAAADPATLAWVLDQISITAEARLPGGVAAEDLLRFRDGLTARLRALAFRRARR